MAGIDGTLARIDGNALTRAATLIGKASGEDGRGRLAALSFVLGVVVPFLLAAVYYGLIATPQYQSEARFAVRTLGGEDVLGGSRGDAGSRLLATTPLQQEAYVVTSFIHSPAIIERLSDRLDFTALFTGNDIDALSRLSPGFTREDLFDYWSGQVTTDLDGPSGIVTLRVRAFSAEDARAINEAIIAESEVLANELSQRAREDYVRRAETEVAARERDYKRVLSRLSALQNETTMLDPTVRASETGTLLVGLLAQKLDVDARLFVLEQQSATASPALRQLQRAQGALEGQIQDLRSQLADGGTVDANLSGAFRRFAGMETERMLTAELYGASRRNLAQARADANAKAVYVTSFVPPELAETSRYPRRLATPLLILLGLSIVWGIAALGWASVEDHRT